MSGGYLSFETKWRARNQAILVAVVRRDEERVALVGQTPGEREPEQTPGEREPEQLVDVEHVRPGEDLGAACARARAENERISAVGGQKTELEARRIDERLTRGRCRAEHAHPMPETDEPPRDPRTHRSPAHRFARDRSRRSASSRGAAWAPRAMTAWAGRGIRGGRSRDKPLRFVHARMDHDSYYTGREVLVTGGLGFLGSNLAIALFSKGARVVVIDALTEGDGGNRANLRGFEGIDVVVADIANRDATRPLVERAQVIFNLSAR